MKDENEEEKDNDEEERGDCREVLATAGGFSPSSFSGPPRTLNTLLCSHSLLLTTRQGVRA